MKNIIELFRPALSTIRIKQEIKKRYNSKNSILQTIIQKYQKNIHILFKYSHFDLPKFTFVDLKKKYYQDNIDEIIVNIMKKVEYHNAEYAIDEYSKTAIITKNNTNIDFYVPSEIEWGSEKFKVTSIQNFESPQYCNIHFSTDSPITIPKRSLNCYKIRQIYVPSTSEIEEGFSTCPNNIGINIIDIKNEPKKILYASGVISTKSNPELDSFDILLTAGKQVFSLCPERFIKRIGSYSFFSNDLSHGLNLRYCDELESIGEFAFCQCKITEVTFPSSLITIEKEAFRSTNLRRITFQFDSKLKEIGVLAFSNCNITQVKFPPSLIKLGYGSFCYNEIDTIKFYENSKLEEIGGDSFGVNKLKQFKLPKNVKKIGRLAFSDDDLLNEFEITSKQLPEIEEDIFTKSIEKFIIPSNLLITNEDKDWCKYIFQAKNIQIKSIDDEVNIKYIQNFIVGKQNINDNDFCVLYYVKKDVNKFEIPSFIKIINENCFSNCKSLKNVTIENNSNLSIIEDFAFNDSSIEELSIPSNICVLNNYCFGKTDKLIRINIIQNNEINVIYYNDSILISKSNDDDNEEFDTINFIRRDLKKIAVPHFVKKMSSSAFNGCKRLNEIVFEKNSKLNLINENQFFNLNIGSIKIPKNVVSIGKRAFANCKRLKFIDFDDDSNLSSINDEAFKESDIQCLLIPSSVSSISKYAFYGCNSIKIYEIGKNVKLNSIWLSNFNTRNNIVIMVPSELSHKVKF